jgi:pimeloyl-ACP methyl ester carboxylesterase
MNKLRSRWLAFLVLLLGFGAADASADSLVYRWEKVDGLNIFYREGGPQDAPTLVLLHGYPLSSIQYDKLMTRLAHSLHVIAMDYPSFGFSDAPPRSTYAYTFDHIAATISRFLALRNIKRYGLYMQDYGVPVGFRLMTTAPQEISFIAVQNGVIHLDGFQAAQDPNGPLRSHWRNRNATIDQHRKAYAESLKYPGPEQMDESDRVGPEVMLVMRDAVQRPDVADARNDLWFDYGSNIERYPQWQALLRKLAVPTLVVWGSQDDFFTTPGAIAYLRDAPKAEVHILDAVHFASLEKPDEVAAIIESFLDRHPLSQNGGLKNE